MVTLLAPFWLLAVSGHQSQFSDGHWLLVLPMQRVRVSHCAVRAQIERATAEGDEGMAAMDVADDEDIWANTISSPSASPPRRGAAASRGFVSTQLSLNSDLQLLSSRGSPPRSAGEGVYAADAFRRGAGLAAGFCNAAASLPSLFSYAFDDHGVRGAADEPMRLAPGAACAWSGALVGGADRRKQRMIKNRESAARSRARKHAHLRELEGEVQLLQQENDILRAKYEKLRMSVEVPVPVKTLRRTSSAPL